MVIRYNRQRPSFFNFIFLFVIWILLTGSYSLGNVLLAVVLSIAIPAVVGGFQREGLRVRKHRKAFQYFLIMLSDIVLSNFVVAKQVLGKTSALKPGFIAIPLDMKEALPITLFASTISLTPGTVSTELSADRKTLYVHALHIEDEQELIASIKKRYEARLKEIFEC
ncbi:Na+/H+ antiporter subunit E [Reinekea marina]|uniref:Na+/H+ antiporter subunit E n=1 Tax=Reinekea marina TaxID=1310421 RepID=A0ABV7WQZ1_9GAMM|nr:Na+/H+ antiporter subunit E [Reinekea marina]MDN3648125.1 Na+/H+ antiporter subunit E [Reinekea marina]